MWQPPSRQRFGRIGPFSLGCPVKAYGRLLYTNEMLNISLKRGMCAPTFHYPMKMMTKVQLLKLPKSVRKKILRNRRRKKREWLRDQREITKAECLILSKCPWE